MFTADLADYRIQQEELIRRAAHYRLVKSLEDSSRFFDRVRAALGQLMVTLGQQLAANAQPSR